MTPNGLQTVNSFNQYSLGSIAGATFTATSE